MIRRLTPALALLGALAMLSFWCVAIPCPSAFDYGEGDTASWIWLLRHGRDLYAAPTGIEMVSANYPPFGLGLVALLAPSDHAILITGRLVSLCGLLLAMGAAAFSVSQATGSRTRGGWAALLVGMTCAVGYHGVVCRPDALALGLGAVAVALAARRVNGWPIWCALLFSVSLLVKHNLVVMPAGLALWALRRERRAGILFLVIGAVVGGAAFFGFHLWRPLVGWSVAGWRATTFLRYLGESVAPSLCGLLLAGWLWRNRTRMREETRRALDPWLHVLAVGVVWWLALGRVGSSPNYLLEFLTALTVVVVVAAAQPGAPRALFTAHVGLAAVETTAWVVVLLALVIPQKNRELVAAHDALAGVDGPVVAEQTWEVVAQGRTPAIVPWLTTAMVNGGRWDASRFLEALDRGQIARVLTNVPVEELAGDNVLHGDFYFKGEVERLRARYQLVRHDGSLWVYAPLSRAGAADAQAASSNIPTR